jgi:hypothetical protein
MDLKFEDAPQIPHTFVNGNVNVTLQNKTQMDLIRPNDADPIFPIHQVKHLQTPLHSIR